MKNNDIIPGFDSEKPDHLEIRLQKIDEIKGCIVVALYGLVSEDNHHYFLRCLKKIFNSGFNKLIVSLSGLTKITAIFSRYISLARAKVNWNKGDLVLIEAKPETSSIFARFGYNNSVFIEPDLKCALEYFRNWPESVIAREQSRNPEGYKRSEFFMNVLRRLNKREPDDPETLTRTEEFAALLREKTGMAALKGYIPETHDIAWMPEPFVSTRLIIYRQVPSNPGIICVEYSIAHMLDEDIYATDLSELAKSVQRWIAEYIEPLEQGEHFAWTFQRYQYQECRIDGGEIEYFAPPDEHERQKRPYLRHDRSGLI